MAHNLFKDYWENSFIKKFYFISKHSQKVSLIGTKILINELFCGLSLSKIILFLAQEECSKI